MVSPCYLRGVEFLMALLFGTASALVGMVLPGMLNMTAVSISVKNGKRAGMLFSAGMAFTTGLHAFAGFGFADFLRKHADFLERLQGAALVLFLILAAFFLYKGTYTEAIEAKKISGRKHFGGGMMMGTLNALSLVYFFALGTVLVSKDLVQNGIVNVVFFSLGASLGAFIIFWLYVKAATWISQNALWLTRNMNYVIGGFFIFLAALQAYNMYG